ncbi:MAG: type II secretion system protein, partial [Gammaproteobacteria bacterium]|nr:type II secretion system protein [Gammaproteobacteria bacterium]
MYQRRASGFTLIELIMVLVVLGALAMFVMPRLNTSSYDSLSFQQELKTAIRYAHKTSLAAECEVQVVLTANSYALFYPDNTCNPPDGFGAFAVNHPV